MIHAYASRPHYFEHLEPIWLQLPKHVRGEVFSPSAKEPWGTARPRWLDPDDVVLVASFVDSRKMGRNPVIYLEHGAGQTYGGDPRSTGHGSYAGGGGHEHTALFLSPNEEVAGRWRTAYPAIPARAVGCPKLDRYGGLRGPLNGDQTVAFSFHWENPLCPESRSALPYYRQAMPEIIGTLRERGWRVLGHGHPREMGALARLWRSLDVPVVESQDYVLRHASVFVADNTSALFESAAVGIPTVVLSAPWYRRDVHHGLRFWDTIPGIHVEQPADLLAAVERAQERRHEDEAHRAWVTCRTYSAVDGQATQRAVDAILETI